MKEKLECAKRVENRGIHPKTLSGAQYVGADKQGFLEEENRN